MSSDIVKAFNKFAGREVALELDWSGPIMTSFENYKIADNDPVLLEMLDESKKQGFDLSIRGLPGDFGATDVRADRINVEVEMLSGNRGRISPAFKIG